MSAPSRMRLWRFVLRTFVALCTVLVLFALLSLVRFCCPGLGTGSAQAAHLETAAFPSSSSSEPPLVATELPSFPPARLELAVDPAQAEPGERLTLTVRVEAQEELASGWVRVVLPPGLEFESSEGSETSYLPAERSVHWPLGRLPAGGQAEVHLRLRMGEEATDLSVLRAELRVPGFRAAVVQSVEIRRLFPPTEGVITPLGGELRSADGRVRVLFPAGAVTQTVRVQHVPREVRLLPPGQGGLALEFELTAWTADEAALPVTAFARPLELRVDLRGLLDWQALRVYQYPFLGYRNEASGQWLWLEHVHPEGEVLVGQVEHLSYFGGGTANQMATGWVLAYNEAQVSTFDGALIYHYPLQTPEGRGGLGPDLDLNYHSRRVDGTLTWVQSDWAGLGWEVDSMSIVRQVNPTADWPWGWVTYENSFTLLYQGTAYRLVPESSSNPYGRYHTEDEQFLYLERRNTANSNGSPSNTSSEYWWVQLRDGTRLRLGYITTSEQVVSSNYYDNSGGNECDWSGGNPPTSSQCYAGHAMGMVAFRWRADLVTDTHGNEMQFSYAEEAQSDPARDRASYLSTVEYNRLSGGQWGSKISFNRSARGSDGISDTVSNRFFYQDDFLSSVAVQQYVDGAYRSIREYQLGYDARNVPPEEHDNHTRRLASIREYGYGGISGGQALPTTTLAYQVYMNKGWDCGQNCSGDWDREPFRYERLLTLCNGYGSETVLSYDAPEARDSLYWGAWNYRVREKRVSDGQSGGYKVLLDYTAGITDERCYDNNSTYGCDVGLSDPCGHLVGYRQVTETLKTLGNSAVAVTGHTFELNRETDSPRPSRTLGRESQTLYRDATATDLKKVVTVWADEELTASSAKSYFVYAQYVTEYLREGTALALQKGTAYAYETGRQAGFQCGNPTRVEEKDKAGTTQRMTLFYYSPNVTNTWIVDRLATKAVFSSSSTSPDAKQTVYRFLYDVLTNTWDTPPVRGDLVLISQSIVAHTDNNYVWLTQEVITYSGAADYYQPLESADGGGHVTAVQYDPGWKMYPLTVTQRHSSAPASSLTTTRQYTYAWGQVSTITGPNGAGTETRYEYDAWGRLTKVIRPGDSSATPTALYDYCDTCTPLRITVKQLLAAEQNTLPTARFYNGLGQLIQEHQGSTDRATMAVSDWTYNAQGLQAEAYAPYSCTFSWNLQSLDTSRPKTHYAYDALGRATTVTHPSGDSVHSSYNGLRQAVVDENNRQKVYGQDCLGRVVTVSEYSGSYAGGPGWGDAPYATTWYTYTTLDQLAWVRDALSNTTAITYDDAGRKVAMQDPDMGLWSYGYDGASNLITQCNALGQVITFTYDGLNRLAGKSYPAGSGMSDVSYSYDSTVDGNRGKGLRTGMSDGSGGTAWGYDERGRMRVELKYISSGGGFFWTRWGYNAADQVVTMTYPGLELLTTTFTTWGQPESLQGTKAGEFSNQPYVSSTWYNALGLPTQMALSDTVVIRWGYFGLGGEWDSHPALGWDNFGRLESVRTSAPSLAPLLDLRYDYDAAGNVTRWANFRYQVGNWPASFSIADNFNVSNTMTFTYSSRQTVPYNDGGQNVCKSSGTGVDLSAQFYRSAYTLTTGNALRLRFKVDQDDTATRLAIETNPSGTYRRLGVVAYGGKLYVQVVEGSTTRYPADLLLDLQTDTWYTLSIVLDDDAGFYLESCQESDPSVRGSYHTPMPAGRSWGFHHWIQNGNCYLDDYREYTDTSGLDWSPKEWLSLGYDSLNRLTGTGALSPWQGYTATYAYNPIGNLTQSNESGVSWSYTYPASGPGSVGPHAVTSLSNGYTYQYDGNGNLVTRTLGSDTYVLQYDLEGRVVEVRKNDTLTVTFVYDGDGRQVKSTVNGVTNTVYIGNYYEKEGNTVRTYYYHAGKRVAMREDGTLYWLLTDHLGSTAMALRATDSLTTERRYYPYGQARYTTTATWPTKYWFTGQREETDIGLYFYNARWYDPALRRFIQPDTIVPEPNNPQTLNRYSYVLNNPLRYTDASGHWGESPLDVAFLLFDLQQIASEGWTTQNTAALVADLACLMLPGATGGGPAARLALAGRGSVAAEAAVRIPAVVREIQAGLKLLQFADRGGYSETEPLGETPQRSRRNLPNETHHVLTNKHRKWTELMREVVEKYRLGLDEAWNEISIPHRGRHAEAYHQWAWELLQRIDQIARGDPQRFLPLFEEWIKKQVLEHPEILSKQWWR